MGMIKLDKEGETPLDDISGLIPKITTRTELDSEEAKSISNAFLKYLLFPSEAINIQFDEPFLRQVHIDMLGNIWTWAGSYRTTQTSIGVEANKIQHKLYQLMDDLKTWTEFWDYKETATKLHHMLVVIHPFLNGNGRWARLITDIWLASQGHETLEWGNENLVDVTSDRSEYILALKEADKGDLTRLQKFMFPEL